MVELKEYKLKDLFSIEQGYAFKSDKYLETGKYRLCTLGNITEDNRFKFNDSKAKYYPEDFPKEFILEAGDLIIPLTEQTYGLFGNTAIIPETKDFKFVLNQRVGKIIENKDVVDKLYLHHLLATNVIKTQIESTATGTTQRNISPDKISDLIAWLPDLSTQKKIADVLSCIDDKIALNNKTNSELENMAKTVYDYWFTQFDFPDANGNPYKTSGGKMEYNQVLKREIPVGWEVGKLSEIANITMGQSPNGESYNENGEGTIFYQGSTDFGTRSPSIRVYTTAPTRFAKVNDILMSVRAPVGTLNIANTDCCIGRGLAALNSKTKSISFLYCIMRNFQRQFELLDSIGTTFGSITKDDLFGLQVVIPKQEVIDAFDKIGNEIFEKQSKLNEENEELTKLRDYLLPLLMNGQIEVK